MIIYHIFLKSQYEHILDFGDDRLEFFPSSERVVYHQGRTMSHGKELEYKFEDQDG